MRLIKILIVLAGIWQNSYCQSKASLENKSDWKFTAGVTLYSNNHYVWDENVMERQPLEFNFRYKVKNNHVLRLSIPISWKVKKAGEPEFPISRYPLWEVSLEDYLEKLQDPSHAYANYYKVLQYDESLFGVSLGYDYNYSFGKYLSLFAGVDFAYNHLQINSRFYNIWYMPLDENGISELGTIDFEKYRKRFIGYSIKPITGLRLNFQKLLFEASLGYMVVKSKFYYDSDGSSIQIVDKEPILSENAPSYTEIRSVVKYFMYNFSLYYSF